MKVILEDCRQKLKDAIEYMVFLEAENERLNAEVERLRRKPKIKNKKRV